MGYKFGKVQQKWICKYLQLKTGETISICIYVCRYLIYLKQRIISYNNARIIYKVMKLQSKLA